MEELVIRFGSSEGARNPTVADIRKAIDDVESFALQREEFSIENVSNWKPDIIEGRQVIRWLNEGPYVTAATFGRESSPEVLGWIVLFHGHDKQSYALATPGALESDFLEGYYCGGPLTIRSGCLVLKAMALEALIYFVEHRDRSPLFEWLHSSKIYRFG
jgi:hypothetical protein